MRGLALFLGIFLLFGCAQNNPKTLGKAPQGPAIKISLAKAKGDSATVTLYGTMIQKCPVAGCWFNLRDETGVIKVDTKAANFVVLDVPLQTSVTVSGLITTNGSERILAATGLSF